MRDTTTITPEERAKLISHVNSGYMTISGEGLKRALAALEKADARAEKAEAMVDWLADKLETNVACPRGDLDLECPFGTSPGSERCAAITYSLPNKEAWGYCWKEAARRAVADAERGVKA